MHGCQLDHLVVTSPSRSAGMAWVEAVLGAQLQVGGEHESMGTHNALLRVGDDRYLEVVAINPTSASPTRLRWFELDRMDPDSEPRLATWVARTDDIKAAAEACLEPVGEILSVSRGPFSWLITIPADGSLPSRGTTPTLIEWSGEQRPSQLLEERGVSLVRLEGFHSDVDRLEATLESLGLRDAMDVRPLPDGELPYLVAHFDTPRGRRTIGGPRPDRGLGGRSY